MTTHRNSQAGHVLLSSSFRYARQRFLFGRARLYVDRIEFLGLSWKGVHRRTIALRQLLRLSWRTDSLRRANVTLYLRDEDPVRLWVENAGLWKYQIEACLGKRLTVTDDLPGSMTSASAA